MKSNAPVADYDPRDSRDHRSAALHPSWTWPQVLMCDFGVHVWRRVESNCMVCVSCKENGWEL